MKLFNYKCTVTKNGTKMYHKRVGGKWKRISNKIGQKEEKKKSYKYMDYDDLLRLEDEYINNMNELIKIKEFNNDFRFIKNYEKYQNKIEVIDTTYNSRYLLEKYNNNKNDYIWYFLFDDNDKKFYYFKNEKVVGNNDNIENIKKKILELIKNFKILEKEKILEEENIKKEKEKRNEKIIIIKKEIDEIFKEIDEIKKIVKKNKEIEKEEENNVLRQKKKKLLDSKKEKNRTIYNLKNSVSSDNIPKILNKQQEIFITLKDDYKIFITKIGKKNKQCFGGEKEEEIKKIIEDINEKLKQTSLNIEFKNYYDYDLSKEITSFHGISDKLLLCLNDNNKCVSSISFDYYDNNIEISSETREEDQGKKYNKLLRAIAIIICSKLKCDNKNIEYLTSQPVNWISIWSLINNFGNFTETGEDGLFLPDDNIKIYDNDKNVYKEFNNMSKKDIKKQLEKYNNNIDIIKIKIIDNVVKSQKLIDNIIFNFKMLDN